MSLKVMSVLLDVGKSFGPRRSGGSGSCLVLAGPVDHDPDDPVDMNPVDPDLVRIRFLVRIRILSGSGSVPVRSGPGGPGPEPVMVL
jgi:hypothetical protein